MKYALKRTDQGGGYVAKPGNKESYTRQITKIRWYDSRAAAEADRCKGNEVVVTSDEVTGI